MVLPAAALAGLGAGALGTGAYLQHDGIRDRERSMNRITDQRDEFAGMLNEERRAQTFRDLNALAPLQERKTGIQDAQLAALAPRVGGNDLEVQDIRSMATANRPDAPAALRAVSPDQKRVAQQLDMDQGPLVEAQQRVAATQLGDLRYGQDQMLQGRGVGLQELALNRDFLRMQQDRGVGQAELSLLDLLQSQHTQRQLDAASNVGAGRQAAGGLLSQIGGGLVGNVVGGLF